MNQKLFRNGLKETIEEEKVAAKPWLNNESGD